MAEIAGRRTPAPVRLHVLDGGTINQVGAREFGFADGALPSQMFTPCFLVVHPRGTLLWDTGEIPDHALNADGTPTKFRAYTVSQPLLPQLAALGYRPEDITYLALSHYHNDHVANANAFAGSVWITQRAERDAMFSDRPDFARNGPIAPDRSFFSALEHAETIVLEGTDHDVFGDGSVLIKFTPGHTPGHQSLFVRLAHTGPVLISGDLYHYTQELHRSAAFVNHASNDLTSRSRAMIERFAQDEGAQIWIQHDAAHGAQLKKFPACYD
jgi:glyoxylase-like metal-dependent hydrolase (beta-lactamase superfamily II)